MKLRINSFGKSICPPAWSWDTSQVPWYDYDLWVVLNGSGILEAEDRIYDISRGDCFCLGGGQHYIGRHNADDPLTVIHIHFDYIDDCDNPIRPYEQAPIRHRKIIELTMLETMLHRLLLSADPIYSYTSTPEQWLACILDLITDWDRANAQLQPKQLQTLSLAVSERLKEQPHIHHKIKDLASYFGYSSDHLSRTFRADTGRSLEQYIIESRINQATLLLINSNMAIKEIAQSLGYKDIYHFSKQFKNVTGCAPSAYRRMMH